MRDLPPEAQWVHGDPAQLQQVLTNLALNGCGMTEKARERIFEPFFTSKAREKGTGLGLAIVHGIHEHQGHITVRSEVDHGSEFEVTLPRVEPRAAPPVDEARDELIPRRPASATILVAEDNEAVLRLVLTALESAGFDAHGVPDGRAVIQWLDEQPDRAAIVLLEIDMPRLSGSSCLEILRERHPRLPVVMMSGNGALLTEARRSLDVPILSKPFKLSELIRAVEDALGAQALHAPGGIEHSTRE